MGTREAGFASSCPATASSRARRTARSWRRSGTCRSIGFRPRAAWRIPTSSRRRSTSKIRALWIIATNPIVSFPNLGVLQQALETLEFLVVQDGFHPTPTTEFAHLVLPAAIWGEKEGTYTNSERRVSKVNRAVDAAGRGARPTSTSSSLSPSALGVPRRALPGLDDAGRRVRGMEARLRRPALRLLRHDLRGDRAARRHAVAVSGRRAPIRRDAPPLRRRQLPDRRRQGAADCRSTGSRSPSSRTTSSRSC